MRADKTLVAGAAAATPRTLDMSKFYEGQAKVATQQANNIMRLFATEKETNLNLLKEIKKMTDDIGVYDGGEKAAGFFHAKVRENAGQTTEENLDDQKYKAKRYKDFRDQVAVSHGNLIDLFSNEQNINIDATYSGSLKNAKSSSLIIVGNGFNLIPSLAIIIS